MLCYTDDALSSWGFLTKTEDDSDPRKNFQEWFKIFLDPKEYKDARSVDPTGVPPSHEDVRRYYRDFLGKLCSYIERQLEDQVGNFSWQDAHVEFLFSVPTTWTAVGVTKDFERLAREAGFGKAGARHTVAVGLTEAEAAAVYTLKTQSASYAVSIASITMFPV